MGLADQEGSGRSVCGVRLCALESRRSERVTFTKCHEASFSKGEIAMNREDIIEHLVNKYQEALEEKDDEELLGSSLEKMREKAIEEMVASYRESVEDR